MQERPQDEQITYFTNLCKRHRLRVTPQRIAIYKTIINSIQHPTAENIFSLIQSGHPHISFDTVNRTLNTFSKLGIINTVESFSGSKRFDPKVTSHHHIHCINCGDIIDFENTAYDALKIKDEIKQKYKVISKRVVINVICNKCGDQ